MRPKWVNLYGVSIKDRDVKTANSPMTSSFMGRILMSFHLVPNERPQLQSGGGQPSEEPNVSVYQLWVDMYDLINAEQLSGNKIWVRASIGQH